MKSEDVKIMNMNEIIAFLEKEESIMRNKWDRTLPRFEYFNNRWDKAERLGFQKGANIYDLSYVFGTVEVGEKTWIGPYTLLDGTGILKIGKYCNISAGVQIYTHSSLKWVLTGGRNEYERQSTSIGDCTYIGSLSVINMGVKIGDHCIVAANSYVNKSFPDYSIIAGTPAKLIGKVEIEDEIDVKMVYSHI